MHAWQLLAGAQPDALSPVASTRSRGFESELAVSTAAPYLAVQALDADAVALGRSETVSA